MQQVAVPKAVGAVILAGMPVFEKRVRGKGIQNAGMEQNAVESRAERFYRGMF